MRPNFDILFLGGGNFATLAVNRLLETGYAGKIGVVDRREDFSDNHRWCSWWQSDSPEPAGTTARWHQYLFRDGGETHTRQLERWKYVHVDAAKFYGEAHARWDSHPGVQLLGGCEAGEVKTLPDGRKLVNCGSLQVTASLVLDSRYRTDLLPSHSFLREPGWWQSFCGRVVGAVPAVESMNRDAFGLMDFDLDDPDRFAFGYVLPFPDGSSLYEYTAFDRSAQPTNRMHAFLDLYIRARGVGDATVIGEEQGWLPMVADAPVPTDRPGHWYGGLLGGGARPASGFAFYRNQRRACAVVDAILRGASLPLSEPLRLSVILDRIFLETLVDDPELTRESMRRLLHRLSGDQLAGFLAEEVDWWTLLRTLKALPKLPYLRGAWRSICRAQSMRDVGRERQEDGKGAAQHQVKCA